MDRLLQPPSMIVIALIFAAVILWIIKRRPLG